MINSCLRDIIDSTIFDYDSCVSSHNITDLDINRRLYLYCCSILDFVCRCQELGFICLSDPGEKKFFHSCMHKLLFRKSKLDSCYFIKEVNK